MINFDMLPQGPYDPLTVEPEILKYWLDNNFYKPEYDAISKKVVSVNEMKKDKREPFCIINPPPNAYDRPHIGNVSGYSYQDTFGRYYRMNGRKVLLLPGKDHAGQEGEAVFIKAKLLPNGKKKSDFTREDFYKACYKHNEENMNKALSDEKRIGMSSDFDRNIFTLDPRVVDIILGTFIKMYKENMVYKGVRIINWSPGMQSAISDNDISRSEREVDFVYIKYPVIGDKKVWYLNFYDSNIINAMVKGTKTVETRALNPEEPGRYFGDIKVGDFIVCVDKNNNGDKSVIFSVKGVRVYSDIADFLKKEDLSKIYVSSELPKTVEDVRNDYNKYALNYGDKVIKNGIVAIEICPAKFDDFVEVATTRPETMLGDTAVAVNPSDKRYSKLIGKNILLPLVNRVIPIIVSSKVEKDFGTGALKLTPAHAPEDYYMMIDWNNLSDQLNSIPNNKGMVRTDSLGYVSKNKLKYWKEIRSKVGNIDYINVIYKDLKLHGPIGKYVGLSVEDAKKKILEDLESLGLVSKIEKIMQNVSICDRTKTVVEPIMSSQWFVDVNKNNFKQNAIRALRLGLEDPENPDAVIIHPKNMTEKALYWLDNLRDWPISRSIWWGYRIPVWYKGKIDEFIDENGKVKQTIGGIPFDGAEDAEKKGLLKVQTEPPQEEGWIQDDDCFDTWYSSGQWPYATLKAWGLEDIFYPTSVMETMHDILEVWVCRMIMFSMYNTRKIPFKHVYLHGMVLASDGNKMSKSKGNATSIDDIINKYGADTLRLFYITGNKAGAAYRIDWEKIEGYRRFLNKLWNASKFILSNIEDAKQDVDITLLKRKEIKFSDEDKIFISEIEKLKEKNIRFFSKFRIDLIIRDLQNIFWHKFCDEYIESVKGRLYTKDRSGNIIEYDKESRIAALWTLRYCLVEFLKMMHPFIPFITEYIWQNIDKKDGESDTLMYQNWIVSED